MANTSIGGGPFILLLLVLVVGAAFYFLPTIIGFMRNQPNKVAILVLNFFLGWSFIGWVIALVWAFKNETATPRA